MFNPNELIIERVRSVEEYDITTNVLTGRYTQIEDPSLTFTADGTDVVDAMGSPITTFYENQQGTFSFSNSLFSLDLAASQFGTTKIIGSDTAKILVPITEKVAIDSATHKATLTYVPAGAEGAEVSYVKIINSNNTFGVTYVADSTSKAPSGDTQGTFVVDAETKTLTFDETATGNVLVTYQTEKANAVKVSKNTSSVPDTKMLIIHVIFHDPCDVNIKYLGSVIAYRAQIDPSSIDVSLTKDGKHAATYKLTKPYCNEDANLVDIIVADE